MRTYSLCVLLILSLGFLKGSTRIYPCANAETVFRCVGVKDVHDGDGFKAILNNVNPFFSPILVRINGIDAPEIRSRDACEKARAIEAREFLKGILDKAARIDLVNVKKDKYFRLLADVQADGVDVGTEILQKKLARPYHGEAKTAFDWCSSR